jgi:hypothetical protein
MRLVRAALSTAMAALTLPRAFVATARVPTPFAQRHDAADAEEAEHSPAVRS